MIRGLSIALMGVLATGLAATALSQPGGTSTASFQVQVIEASKGATPHVDKRLKHMKRHFKPFLGQYNRFVLLANRELKLKPGGAGSILLPGKKTFTLQFTGFATGKVRRVRYTVQMPHTRMKRSVAPGGQTMDVVRNGATLTIVSTLVR